MERFLSKIRVAAIVAVLLIAGAGLAVQMFGNHAMFRTYGLDLGIYTKALYDYSHLRFNDCTFYLWEPSNLLADHFDIQLFLLSPLSRVADDGVLLAVQLIAVLFGALGMGFVGRQRGAGAVVQIVAVALPLVTFGTWHATSFDYHSNVLSAMLLPWLLYSVEKARRRLLTRGRVRGRSDRRVWPWWSATIVLILILIGKESSALWAAAVLLALMWDYRRDKAVLRWLIFSMLGCLAYFAAVTLLVMPSLGGSSRGFWRYDWMGGSFGEVAGWIVTHPLQAVRDLFVDFTPAADKGYLKTEFLICLMLSGGAFCVLKPNYLLMLIPPMALKMLAADSVSFWGISNHYNVEMCMVACAATVVVLTAGRRRGQSEQPWRRIVAVIALVLTFSTLIYTVNHPRTFIRQANVNIIKPVHYQQTEFGADEAHRMIRMIPKDASVCATTMFTPHLASRDSVYIFPMGLAHNVEYYLLLRSHWSYYEGEEEEVARLIADTAGYETLASDGQLFLLRKRGK